MAKKISIYTIARELGLSSGTVSKVINNQGSISEDTIARVRDAIKKYNYIPQQRKQTGNAIGVVLFEERFMSFESDFVRKLLNGICFEAFRHSRDVTMIDGERLKKLNSSELYCYCTTNSLSGLLVINLSESDNFIKVMYESSIPFILLANAAPVNSNCNYISNNNYACVKTMLNRIIESGHKNIAYMNLFSLKFESHKIRHKAYLDVLQEHGIIYNSNYDVDLNNMLPETIENVIKNLLALKIPPDTIFFGGELLSDLFEILDKMNIKVPEDISVAGFMSENIHKIYSIDYSAIYQPTVNIGQLGVTKILELISGKSDSVAELLDGQVHFGSTISSI